MEEPPFKAPEQVGPLAPQETTQCHKEQKGEHTFSPIDNSALTRYTPA
jgi:hypothetical protein